MEMGPTLLFVAVALALLVVVVHQRREIATLGLRLTEASRVDALTGLLNRRAFEEMLDFELDRSRRTGRPVSLIIGEIEGLGRLNAERGHAAGDSALLQVANDLPSGSAGSTPPAAWGARSSALCSPRPTSRAPSWSPSACAGPPAHLRGRRPAADGLVRRRRLPRARRPVRRPHGRGGPRRARGERAWARPLGDLQPRPRAHARRAARPGRPSRASSDLVGLAEELDVRDTGVAGHSHASATTPS